MDKLLLSCIGSFDEVVIYLDGVSDCPKTSSEHVRIIYDGEERSIKDAFNHVISHTTGDWVCSFCDDDYFLQPNLQNLINQIKDGRFDDADIIHFKVLTASGAWGSQNITLEKLMSSNHLPHGSFIRRNVFEDLGGYRIDACADWNLWLRAKIKNYRFEFYPEPIYFFRTGSDRSAYQRQCRDLGTEAMRKQVIENV